MSQKLAFQKIGWKAIRDCWTGYNVSLFAYGQTGSGKSFTMFGNKKRPGVIPRFSDHLFEYIRRAQQQQQQAVKFQVSVQCIEIYNECERFISAFK